MILIQFIYFLLLGWWLGLLAAAMGYLLCASIIGLPFGTLLLNRLPAIIFLQPREYEHSYGYAEGRHHEDIPFILRVIWFFLLGWELGAFATLLGYVLVATFIFMPFGIWLLNRTPFILTLSRRYD